MRIIYGEKGSGKTSRIINTAFENDALIITYSEERAEKILNKAERLGKTIKKPIAINTAEFEEYSRSSDPRKDYEDVIIDNVSTILSYFIRGNIIEGTLLCPKNKVEGIQ